MRRAILSAALGSPAFCPLSALAQQGWQPTRITPRQQQAVAGQVPVKKRSPVFEDDAAASGQNVIIRWKDSGRSNAQSQQSIANGQQVANQQHVANYSPSATGLRYGEVFQGQPRQASYNGQFADSNSVRTASGTNPLRSQSSNRRNVNGGVYRQASVQPAAAYQQGNQAFDPFGDDTGGGFPSLPDNLQPGSNAPQDSFPSLPQDNGFQNQPQGNGLPTQPQNMPQQGNGLNSGNQYGGETPMQNGQAEIGGGAGDPLNMPESAPAPMQGSDPSNILEQGSESNPFPGADSQAGSASDRGTFEDDDNGLTLPDQRDRQANSLSCNDLRDRFLNQPLSVVKLNTSPKFGIGLRGVKNDTEDERLKFASESEIRDWRNNSGELVASGRLTDLKNDKVVLDVYGKTREIALRDLSDRDLAYVGEKWNIPLKCGTGNISYEGRSHMHSVVQWKAPGHCHKPLYFEQPQLERYGHTAGPVIQPLISSAHFFTNIGILPYKMGIHPPNECQYSLGYYRPGNCAPYMMQPFPWSLRGAATQAGAVVGLGALVP